MTTEINSLSLASLPSPWVVSSSEEHPRIQSFYNIEEDSYYVKEVEDMSGRLICATFREWVVIHEPESSHCFLSNIDSLEKIDLPPLEIKDYRFCLLSSSPKDEDCIVAFALAGKDKRRIMYCNPNDKEWAMHEFEGDIGSFTVSKGKIYALYESDSIVELNFVNGKVELRNLVPGLRYPEFSPSSSGAEGFKSYLFECLEDMFLVVIWFKDESGHDVEEMKMYKIDYHSSKWVEVKSLGDGTTFFIDGDTNSVSCSVTTTTTLGTNLKANTVYFMLNGGTSIHVLEVGDKRIYPLLPLTDMGCRWLLLQKTPAELKPE